jgi:hypothetical protein
MFVVMCPVFIRGAVFSDGAFRWLRNRPVYSHGTTDGWEHYGGAYPVEYVHQFVGA